MNSRERLLAMLDGRPVDRLPLMPITMMFAADQAGVSYGDYAARHEVLVESQILTASKFHFDYVSVISDPAREAADCGAAVHYFPDQPPAIDESHALLTDKRNLDKLPSPDPMGGGRMTDRVQAVALFKQRVGGEKLVEGWVEGPCAESADLRGINTLMTDFFDDAGFVNALFQRVVDTALRFARVQVDAGADIIGVGDAAASLVGPQIYDEFVLPYEKKLVDGLHAMGTRVRLHICGNIRRILKSIGTLGCDMVDIDWMVPMAQARQDIGPTTVLAGNLDPVKAIRAGTPESIAAAIAQCHREAGSRYIIAAGCEIPRDTVEANVLALAAYAAAHAP